jgi:3D (Asp-Asp-Asp) domain-containing protein
VAPCRVLPVALGLFAVASAVAPTGARASLVPPGDPLAAARFAPLAGAGDASKGGILSDGDDPAAKLPIRGKVKECCGYPLDVPGGFRLTFYWLAYESEYANEKYDTPIYTREGFFIGRYPEAFVFELKLEGSGILRDGRVINYDGECTYGSGTCFKTLDPAEYPQGRGVQNRALEAFRSVAVDPRFIPIGATLYVPEIVGLQLPDGTRHDGCLRADDQGGAIKFHKMDFFVESYFNFKFLADQLWWKLKATPHVDEPRCDYLRLHATREFDNEQADWAHLHEKKFRQAVAREMRLAKKREVLTASAGFGGRRHSASHSGGKRVAVAKHGGAKRFVVSQRGGARAKGGAGHALAKKGGSGHSPIARRGR